MRRFTVLAVALAVAACSGGSPSGPSTMGSEKPATTGSAVGANSNVSSMNDNSPPTIVVKTTPKAIGGVLAGPLPMDARINLCNSSDPDPGDSLRFEVDWGDGTHTGNHHPGAGTDPQDGVLTGCGGPSCCRHR